MKKAGLQKNLKNFQRKCAALAVTVGKSFSPAAIHQFRIEYKKLRSYLTFVSTVDGDEKKFSIRKRAKKRYELAGQIRDEFLFLQRFRLMAPPGTVFLHQHVVCVRKSISALKKAWKNAKPFPPLEKCLIKHPANRFPDKLSLADFNDYLENNERHIFSMVKGKDLSDSQLHSLRKVVKERSYNLRWWEKQKGEKPVSKKIKKQMAGLHRLLIDLGNYHDLVNFQLRLKKSGKRETNIGHLKQLYALQEKVNAEKQKINSKLVSEIGAVCRE
jgi:CHAD domain-containing protein